MSARKYVIFDLDNCLCNDAHRIPLIDWAQPDMTKRYALYHSACASDRLGNAHVFDAARAHGLVPIFLTGRCVTAHDATMRWLMANVMTNAHDKPTLIMRNEGDNRPSAALKRMAIGALPEYGINENDIMLAYDDHPEVLEMYRQRLPFAMAHELRIHDLDAYAPPRAPRAPENLEAGAATFRQRNAVYGDAYLAFGNIAASFFPAGLALRTPEEWTRFGLWFWTLSKQLRYASQLKNGGHKDSAHDLMVYAAMLEEVTAP